jgi:hypothetical protein
MKPLFAFCLYLQKNIEILCLTLLLKTGNIVHELVTESFTNQPFFWFVNERVIEKYGRVRCINIFADYGLCVFHLC